ncbi:glycosyltransferase [Saccharibacillus sp. O23]|nr:glycosyltransferase family 2 protein [Saccharibacillus sp. O23]OWR28679.1 glycosyltransferase [Saccharibacillus sp. O23]
MTRISVIIPMYNEEAVIAETYRRLTDVMRRTGDAYELIFVNDGGVDRSPAIIRELSAQDESVKLIDFSRNFGHQIAVTAGMDYASGDAVIIIDADLQDPPHLILDMLDKWREGYDVVYAQRIKRNGETLFKKWSAALFYRILRASTDVPIPVDTGDFRLIDRKVCDEMNRLGERNPFVRGLVSWTGFRQTSIEYERDERLAGETKYPLKKMIKLCLDGLTSFSHKPLKMAGYAGGVMSAIGFLYMLYVLGMALFTDSTIRGWASTICLMLIFNGFTLIMLGVIGEYIGRIYDEVKGRPLYIVRETLNMQHVPARQNAADRGRAAVYRPGSASARFADEQAAAYAEQHDAERENREKESGHVQDAPFSPNPVRSPLSVSSAAALRNEPLREQTPYSANSSVAPRPAVHHSLGKEHGPR